MRFLADENVPSASVRRLREAGHEVIATSEVLPGCMDSELLEHASAKGAIVVTFDRDFGALVFQLDLPAPDGIVLLRIVPNHPEDPAEVLLSILADAEVELRGRLTVVERDRLRQRLLP